MPFIWIKRRGGWRSPWLGRAVKRKRNISVPKTTPGPHSAPSPTLKVPNSWWKYKPTTETETKRERSQTPKRKVQVKTLKSKIRRVRAPRGTIVKGIKGAIRRVSKPGSKKTYMIQPRSAGSTYSKFRTTFKRPMTWMKIMKRMLPRQVYLESTTHKSQCAITGTQTYYSTLSCTKGDVVSLFTRVPSATYTTEMYYQGCRRETLITNMTNTNVFMDIYEVRARKLTQLEPGQAIQEGVASMEQGNTGNGTYDAFALGLKPFDVNLFCKQWKVLKRYKIELQEGKSHKHESRYTVNQHIQYETLLEYGSSYLGSVTHGILIIHSGSPGYYGSGDGSVTTTRDSLAIVNTYRHQYQYVSPIKSEFRYTDMLGHASTEFTVKVREEATGSYESQENP